MPSDPGLFKVYAAKIESIKGFKQIANKLHYHTLFIFTPKLCKSYLNAVKTGNWDDKKKVSKTEQRKVDSGQDCKLNNEHYVTL